MINTFNFFFILSKKKFNLHQTYFITTKINKDIHEDIIFIL